MPRRRGRVRDPHLVAEHRSPAALAEYGIHPAARLKEHHDRPLRAPDRRVLDLPNRLVMAPLTRNRAKGTVPGDLQVEYYAQRASAGLIITEGSQPSARGQGYLDTPGFHSPEQLAGWRRVADAVHAADGRIVAQLMHAGPDRPPRQHRRRGDHRPQRARRARRDGHRRRASSRLPVPRALETDEVPEAVQEYVTAARNADRGRPRRRRGPRRQRLPDPPVPRPGLQPAHRRVRRLARRTAPASPSRSTRAVVDAIGADRVGMRISPAHNIQGATEEDPADVEATYTALVAGHRPARPGLPRRSWPTRAWT